MNIKLIYEEAYQEIIFKIRTARKHKGLNQSEFAQIIKKDQKYVSRVENCEKRLDILELWEILDILDMDFKSIMSRFDDRMKEQKSDK